MKAVLYLIGAGLLGIAVYTLGPEIAEARCKSRWSPGGLNATWVLGTGCMVNVDGMGRWIPEANVQIPAKAR